MLLRPQNNMLALHVSAKPRVRSKCPTYHIDILTILVIMFIITRVRASCQKVERVVVNRRETTGVVLVATKPDIFTLQLDEGKDEGFVSVEPLDVFNMMSGRLPAADKPVSFPSAGRDTLRS